MAGKGVSARVLHCVGRMDALAAERLPERLGKLGSNLVHDIVGLSPEEWRDAAGSRPSIKPNFLGDFPKLSGTPGPGRLMALANAVKPYDLVLTYGWGAINVAMAHTLFSEALKLPPLVHHETALVGEEKRLSKRRTWFRRIAFGRASGLVVPTERLEGIALTDWQQPLGRVKRFAPGVEVPSDLRAPANDALRGLIKRDGERWIGIDAASSDTPSIHALVAVIAEAPEAWHLVLLGACSNRDALEEQAEDLSISHRVHFQDEAGPFSSIAGLFDVFVDASRIDTLPTLVLQAMAHSLPVLTVHGSNAAEVLPETNRRCVAAGTQADDLKKTLFPLLESDSARQEAGKANREAARVQYAEDKAIDRYRRLYASALGIEIRT